MMEGFKDTALEKSKDGKQLFNGAMLNIITYLESLDDVCNIDFQIRGAPCSSSDISSWERKNVPYKLPNDVKALYELFNGFSLKWKVSVGVGVAEIGSMTMHKLDQIARIPVEGIFISSSVKGDSSNEAAASSSSDDANNGNGNGNGNGKAGVVARGSPTLTPDISSCAAFVIDNSPAFGQITLLYRPRPPSGATSSAALSLAALNGTSTAVDASGAVMSFDNPEVWLLDTSCRWHFLAPTVSQYLRLMVVHLGIVGWVLGFTPEGFPATTQQWLHVYCKERLILDLHHHKKRQLQLAQQEAQQRQQQQQSQLQQEQHILAQVQPPAAISPNGNSSGSLAAQGGWLSPGGNNPHRTNKRSPEPSGGVNVFNSNSGGGSSADGGMSGMGGAGSCSVADLGSPANHGTTISRFGSSEVGSLGSARGGLVWDGDQ